MQAHVLREPGLISACDVLSASLTEILVAQKSQVEVALFSSPMPIVIDRCAAEYFGGVTRPHNVESRDPMQWRSGQIPPVCTLQPSTNAFQRRRKNSYSRTQHMHELPACVNWANAFAAFPSSLSD